MIIYHVHRDYQVVKAMLLHAPAPVLYYAPPEVVNRHLFKDVIPVQQVHTKMERCWLVNLVLVVLFQAQVLLVALLLVLLVLEMEQAA